MSAFMRSALSRTGVHALSGLAVMVLLAGMGCSEITGPDPVDPVEVGIIPPAEQPDGANGPSQVVFSLNTMDMGQLRDIVMVDDGVSGPRWCGVGFWVDAGSEEACNGLRPSGPMGEVSIVDGELRIASGVERGAPFVWTGSPSRMNPFPAEGDFALDVRLTIEQVAGFGSGLWVLNWNPAATEASNSPLLTPVVRVWADAAGGIRAMLVGGSTVKVRDNPYSPHWYRLEYEDGAYTLFIDGEKVAGPVATDRRPNAAWLGNPTFADFGAGDWTDFRLAEFTVTAPAQEPQVIEVGVDVKPGGCPSPVQLKAKGVLPAAIVGVEGVLDVSQIDPATIRLEGVPPLRSSFEDVSTAGDCAAGGDGVEDLTLKFDNALVAEALADAEKNEERALLLTGNLYQEFGGTAITGQDVVIIKR